MFRISVSFYPTLRMERSYIMIKPDGVQRGLIGKIISRFEDKGFKIVGLKMLMADDAVLEEHYAELKVIVLD